MAGGPVPPNGSIWNRGGSPILPPDQRPWELYNLDLDYSQTHNLGEQYPEKLEEMQMLFDSEARRNNVYPLEPPLFGSQPSVKSDRTHFVYFEGSQRIPTAVAPSLAGKAHKITAEVSIPESGADGVIVTQGGRHGGFTLYIKDSRLIYETSAYGHLAGSLESSMTISPGKLQLIVEVSPVPNNEAAGGFRRSFPMKACLIINGKVDREMSIRSASDIGTLDVGMDLVSPASPNYKCPNTVTGRVESVTIDLL